MAFTFFPQPIITDLITLGDISYSATPQKDQTLPRSTDGHNVRFEIELVGCENYQLEAGKQYKEFKIHLIRHLHLVT